jgi:hypothetical protein
MLWVPIPLRWSVLDTTLCDKVCQWLAAGRWFSPVRVHFTWAGLALTTLVVIGTDCIGSYKSNWHMITTAPVMVSMLDSSAIDVDQTKVYRTCICCFLGKQTAHRSKSHMPTHRLLLQWARSVLDTTLCDKVCQWLAAGRWFSPVFSTNKTYRHDITKILLKVVLNTINLTITPPLCFFAMETSTICWGFAHTRILKICKNYNVHKNGSQHKQNVKSIWHTITPKLNGFSGVASRRVHCENVR